MDLVIYLPILVMMLILLKATGGQTMKSQMRLGMELDQIEIHAVDYISASAKCLGMLRQRSFLICILDQLMLLIYCSYCHLLLTQ